MEFFKVEYIKRGTMWLIFLLAFFAFAILAMILLWIGNKIFLSMKKSNLDFDRDQKGNNNA